MRKLSFRNAHNSYFRINSLLILGFLCIFPHYAVSYSMGKLINPEINLQNTITGTVVSSEAGTTTDFDGNYSLEVSGPKALIIYSYIGFESQEKPVTNKTTIQTKLCSF